MPLSVLNDLAESHEGVGRKKKESLTLTMQRDNFTN